MQDGAINKIGIFNKSFADLRNAIFIKNSSGIINNGISGLFNSLSSSITSKDIANIKEYNRLVGEEGVSSQTAWYRTMTSSSRACQELFDDESNLIQTENGAILSTETLKHAQDNLTFSAKAETVTLKALAIAGNMIAMWGIITAVKFLAKALDSAADSLEDVKARIQDNQTALSNYTSKVEELTKRLEELNQTDVTGLSEDERKELETEAAYLNSRIELYSQLAETKQKAINDDYIKATMGVNQETAYKKMWEELSNGDWEDLYSTSNEALKLKWYDFLGLGVIPHALTNVDDGNYIAEADKLLDEYQKLQNKSASLQKVALKRGNNEWLDQNIEKTQAMHSAII